MNIYRTPDYRHLPKNVRIPAPSIHKEVEAHLWFFVQLTFSFLASYSIAHWVVS